MKTPRNIRNNRQAAAREISAGDIAIQRAPRVRGRSGIGLAKTDFLFFCLLLFFMAASSFAQSQREYTFENGQLVGVKEDYACTLSAAGIDVASTGANGTFSVSCSGNRAWTAVGSPWISVTQGASGTGSGTVRFYVSPNYGPARVGTITAGGRLFRIAQGAMTCQQSCVYEHQSCSGMASASCPSQCEQEILSQYPNCMYAVGPCMSLYQSCVSSCAYQEEASCNYSYQYCMASCQ